LFDFYCNNLKEIFRRLNLKSKTKIKIRGRENEISEKKSFLLDLIFYANKRKRRKLKVKSKTFLWL